MENNLNTGTLLTPLYKLLKTLAFLHVRRLTQDLTLQARPVETVPFDHRYLFVRSMDMILTNKTDKKKKPVLLKRSQNSNQTAVLPYVFFRLYHELDVIPSARPARYSQCLPKGSYHHPFL